MSYNHGNDIEDEEIDYEGMSEHIGTEAINDGDDDANDEETNEEFYEAIYMCMMEIHALMHLVNQFLNMMRGEHHERPLTRRRITSKGYDYIHKSLNGDSEIFQQVYIMYPDVFRKLCMIIREKNTFDGYKIYLY